MATRIPRFIRLILARLPPKSVVWRREFSRIAGLGVNATFARATNAQVSDHRGRRWEAMSGEARFNGFRRSGNIAFVGGVAKTGETIGSWYTAIDAGVTVVGEDITYAGYNRRALYTATNPVYRWLASRKFAFSADIHSAAASQLKLVLGTNLGPTASNVITTIPAGWSRIGVVGAYASDISDAAYLSAQFSTYTLSDVARSFKIKNILLEELSAYETVPNDYYSTGYKYYNKENGNSLSSAGIVTSDEGKPITVGGGGIHLEAAATNYYPQSDQHSLCSTNTSPNNAAFTANYGANRMGHKKSTFAYKPSGTTGTAIFWRSAVSSPHPAATQYCHWAVVKARGLSKVAISLGNTAFNSTDRVASFDLTTGLFYSSSGTPDGYGIEHVGNGYYKIYVTATTDGDGGTINAAMQMFTDAWNASIVGDSAKGIEILESQVERNAVPSSAIMVPATSAVARNEDTLSYSDVPATNSTKIWYDATSATATNWTGTVTQKGVVRDITVRTQ